MKLTYRYRVKNLSGALNAQAKAVSFVWNFCVDTQKHAVKWDKKWPGAFDLMKLTAGSSKELGILATTVSITCKQFASSRSQHRRLRYRGKKSLGWIPLSHEGVRETVDGFESFGRQFKVFKSRPLPSGAKLNDGSNFSQDARGNWFLNICVEVPDGAVRPLETAVGIDLGLHALATLSDGTVIENPRHGRKQADALAKAQRAGKKRQARNIHSRIVNARVDHLHKLTTDLVRRFDYIAVGNVNASAIAKTKMAKSVNDASWSSLRLMLAFKAIKHGAKFEEVDEKFTTRTCSTCGVIAGPKGFAGLNKRVWTCDCGAAHQRDHNAAINILARGLGRQAPAEGVL